MARGAGLTSKLCLVACFALLFCPTLPLAAYADEGGTYRGGKWDALLPGIDYLEGKVVVTFNSGVSRNQAQAGIDALGWGDPHALWEAGGALHATLAIPEGMSLDQVESEVRERLSITAFQPDYLYFPQPAFTWSRVGGKNALWTMAMISRNTAGFTETSGTVVLATMEGYWDALSASSLAGLEEAPVVLTDKNELSFQARAELARLQPTKVLIMGGTAAISQKVEDEVRACIDGQIDRVAGANAEETARKAAELSARSGRAIVATAGSFHDALSIAPYAYATKSPIFLTNSQGRLTPESLSVMDRLGIAEVIVVGGDAAVPAEVESQLGARFAKRLWGATAVDTSLEIAKWEIEEGMTVRPMGLATAEDWYDALAAGAYCGKNNSILILGAPGRTQAIDRIIADHKDEAAGYVFGGPAAVPDEVASHLGPVDKQPIFKPGAPPAA
ncbi:cell wall-binding repeat-containing protein [Eggerthellaceae bacterium zg-997]|nr:cell wall-binding repeat-containing protein [Eggerthellaceae bacterium zg-997]